MPFEDIDPYSTDMKLSTFAKEWGISYKTAWRWWNAGTLPWPAEQLPTGTIIVRRPEVQEGTTALYARVSGSDQKKDLSRQIQRLKEATVAEDIIVVEEVGSAMNGARPKLMKLLNDPSVTCIVVEHRDRLSRFGFEYISAALQAAGREIVVLESAEVEDDLVRDMIEVLTSFCARLYGKRGARRRAAKGVDAMKEGPK